MITINDLEFVFVSNYISLKYLFSLHRIFILLGSLEVGVSLGSWWSLYANVQIR